MLLYSLGLSDGQGIVDVTPRVDVCCQGPFHGHAEDVTLCGDASITIHTAKICELLIRKGLNNSGGDF